MRSMSRATAAAVMIASSAWSLLVVFSPGRFSAAAATLLAADALILALIAVTGLLVATGPWAWWLAAMSVAAQAALLPALGRAGWRIAAAVLLTAAAAGLVALAPRRLRQRASTDAPPARAAVLLLGLAALPAISALASPGEIGWAQWSAAIAGVVVAWGLSQASVAALWAARTAMPLLTLVAAFTSPLAGALALAVVALALAALAWDRNLALAVTPIAPIPGAAFRIPPELAPMEVLRAAGLDDRGRPRGGG